MAEEILSETGVGLTEGFLGETFPPGVFFNPFWVSAPANFFSPQKFWWFFFPRGALFSPPERRRVAPISFGFCRANPFLGFWGNFPGGNFSRDAGGERLGSPTRGLFCKKHPSWVKKAPKFGGKINGEVL